MKSEPRWQHSPGRWSGFLVGSKLKSQNSTHIFEMCFLHIIYGINTPLGSLYFFNFRLSLALNKQNDLCYGTCFYGDHFTFRAVAHEVGRNDRDGVVGAAFQASDHTGHA